MPAQVEIHKVDMPMAIGQVTTLKGTVKPHTIVRYDLNVTSNAIIPVIADMPYASPLTIVAQYPDGTELDREGWWGVFFGARNGIYHIQVFNNNKESTTDFILTIRGR